MKSMKLRINKKVLFGDTESTVIAIDKINYMKAMLHIYKGSKIDAFFYFIKFPFSLNKIRILILLCIPLFLIKKIKDIN